MAVVLITGCSSGFGLLSAIAFARRRDRVFATMRDTRKADGLREAAVAAGVEVNILALDVTDDASVRKAVEEVIRSEGQVDVLVNNAGVGIVAAVEDCDDDEVLRAFDTNVFGAIRASRAVLPHMRARRSGRIVNVGSMAGVVPSQFRGVYSATKAALSALSDAMFYELHPWGVHSCVVEPGFFETSIGANRMRTRRQGSSEYAPLLERYEGGGSTPGGQQRADPMPVVDVIVQAATEEPPRRHYIVGKDAEALSGLKAKLPDEEFAAVVLRSMPALEQPQQ